MKVVSVSDTGAKRRAKQIIFDNGTELTTSKAVVKALRLEEGAEVQFPDGCETTQESECFKEILESTSAEQCKKRALALIAHRDYTVYELRQRLRWDGYPQGMIDGIITHVTELDLVNDERYVNRFCESRLNAGYGPYVIKKKLALKGIGEDIAHAAIDTYIEEEEFDIDARARLCIERFDLEDHKQRQRALRRLISRGFDYEVARRAMSRSVG